jgi:hypothetical protein
MKKVMIGMFCLSAMALSAFGAGFTVTAPISAGSTQLKPGEYKFEMQGDKVVLKEGRTVIAEIPATKETAAKKFEDTMYESSNGKLVAIRVGGTTTRIVLK